MREQETSHHLADIGVFSISSDNLNFVVNRRNKNGRVIESNYYRDLNDLLSELSKVFVLEEIGELKELKEFTEKFNGFQDEIRLFCVKVEKEWVEHPLKGKTLSNKA